MDHVELGGLLHPYVAFPDTLWRLRLAWSLLGGRVFYGVDFECLSQAHFSMVPAEWHVLLFAESFVAFVLQIFFLMTVTAHNSNPWLKHGERESFLTSLQYRQQHALK